MSEGWTLVSEGWTLVPEGWSQVPERVFTSARRVDTSARGVRLLSCVVVLHDLENQILTNRMALFLTAQLY